MSGRLQLRGTSLMKSSASSPPPYTSMIATTSTTTSSTKPTTITCAAREADVTSRPYHHLLRLRRDLVRPSPLSLAPPEFEEFRPAAIGPRPKAPSTPRAAWALVKDEVARE